MEVDYDSEAAIRMSYVRVRINWNVDEPLKFKRNFQFTPGVNTLLRLIYERLRGFCEVCGLITHDTGACITQNQGAGHHPQDDEDSDNDDLEMPDDAQPAEIREMVEENQSESLPHSTLERGEGSK